MSRIAPRGVINALAGPSRRPFTRIALDTRQISTLPSTAKFLPPTSPASPILRTLHYRTTLLAPPRSVALSPRYASSVAPAAAAPPNSSHSKSSSSAADDPDPEPEPEAEGKSAYERFKAMSKKYGWWAVGVYLLLSPIDFGIILFLIHTFGAERIEPIIASGVRQYRLLRHGEEETKKLEAHDAEVKAEQERQDRQEAAKERKNGGGWSWGSRALWAEIGLAYAIHKTALLPVRAGLTVAITPKLVNWLTKRGWVGKGGLTRAKDHAQGKIKDASQRVRERVRAPAKD